jgi:CheY-like chemotaxis protein
VSPRMYHILAVEDCEGDLRLLKEAFDQVKKPHTLHTVCDGDEALEFAYRQGEQVG